MGFANVLQSWGRKCAGGFGFPGFSFLAVVIVYPFGDVFSDFCQGSQSNPNLSDARFQRRSCLGNLSWSDEP